jgi:hypothetical protein
LNAGRARHPNSVMKSRTCLAVAAFALALVVPTSAAASACPTQPTAQRFLRWSDPGWYAPLPDSGFESGTQWSLTGGAAVVAGNEPFFIGSPADAHSLSLPGGASAASAPVCLSLGSPTLRLLVRNTGAATARLTVTATVTDALGARRTLAVASLPGSAQWAPSPPVAVVLNAASPLGAQQVSFAFAPADASGRWTIDDVYVDPYGKG